MPFIHIKSLPQEQPLDIRSVIEGVSGDFAKAVGIGLEHVTVTWEFFLPGYYAEGGTAAMAQTRESHPLLIDILAPDFNPPGTVQTMLTAVAGSLSERAGVSPRNIFVNYREAHSGQVFDAGEVVRW